MFVLRINASAQYKTRSQTTAYVNIPIQWQPIQARETQQPYKVNMTSAHWHRNEYSMQMSIWLTTNETNLKDAVYSASV